MLKRALLALVLVGAALGIASPDVTLHPTPPPHPDAVPDPVIGSDVHPGYMNRSSGGAPSEYADATSVWNFNDITDLGNDSQGSNNWTLVSSPASGAGALGNAVLFDATNEHALVADAADLRTDVAAWGTCAWVHVKTSGVSNGIHAKWALGGYEHTTHIVESTDTVQVFINGGAYSHSVVGEVNFLNERHLVCSGMTDATTLQIQIDDNAPTSTGGVVKGAAGASAFSIGREATANSLRFTDIGPVMWYRGGFPPATALYNSNYGYSCADIPSAQRVNLVSCWDADESGGTFEDTYGGHDLTTVNSPIRSSGNVRVTGSSQMGVNYGGNGYLTGNFSLVASEASFTVMSWEFEGAANSPIVWNTSTAQLGTTYSSLMYIQNFAGGRAQMLIYDSVAGNSQANVDSVGTGDQWALLIGGYDASNKKAFFSYNGAATVEGAALSNGIRTTATWSQILRSGSSGAVEATQDHVVFWPLRLTDVRIANIWNSGTGLWAVIWQSIFEGPRFAWTEPPRVELIPRSET
jgi:hypothetical protein